jgi:anti-sigma factor RsiW
MTGHPCEEELALYSTGDLDAESLGAIAGHVGGCGECRERVAEFERIGQLVANLGSEREPENFDDDLNDVRQRVLNQVNTARAWRRRFEWAAAAAALIALAVLLHREPSPRVEMRSATTATAAMPNAVTATATARPDQRVSVVPVVRHKRAGRSAGLRSIALITRQGNGDLIRITTADPNVVILLPSGSVSEERTQSNE